MDLIQLNLLTGINKSTIIKLKKAFIEKLKIIYSIKLSDNNNIIKKVKIIQFSKLIKLRFAEGK